MGRTLLVDTHDLANTGVHLAAGIVGKCGINQAGVQRKESAIVGDLEHVVLARINAAIADNISSFAQFSHHALLIFAGFRPDILCFSSFQYRDRQIQHIRRLHIGNLLEHAHQLRQIEELGESGLHAIAGSFGSQLNRRNRFTEVCSPAVKVGKPVLFQRGLL